MELEERGTSDGEAGAGAFRFGVGEEVLARLADAAVTPVGSPIPVRSAVAMPTWTIGSIIARRWRGHALYLLSFRHDARLYLCWIDESGIEGTV